MKAPPRPGVLGARLPEAVPPLYRDAVAAAVSPAGTYTLLLFAHAPRDVVTSAAVRRALRRLDAAAEPVVAVGAVFTDEALALLAEVGARAVAHHTRRWTDDEARGRQD